MEYVKIFVFFIKNVLHPLPRAGKDSYGTCHGSALVPHPAQPLRPSAWSGWSAGRSTSPPRQSWKAGAASSSITSAPAARRAGFDTGVMFSVVVVQGLCDQGGLDPSPHLP